MLRLLLKGIVIGLITGMPLGPIGAICLKTTLTNGAVFGLSAGLGSSLADSIFASIAALGITIIMRFLTRYHHYVRIFGGIILIIFGLHAVFSKKENNKDNNKEIAASKTIIKSFMSTFLLALANPATIFSFLFVFSSYGSKNLGHGFVARGILIVGVFLGSLIWWIILIFTAGKFQSKLTPNKISFINRILGYVIICSGIVFIIGATNYKKYTRPFYIHSKLFEIILHTKFRMPFH